MSRGIILKAEERDIFNKNIYRYNLLSNEI